MKYAVQYGEKVEVPRVPLGEGLVGYAALHKEPVLVADVSQDPRYIHARARRPLRARRSRCCSRIAASASSISRARSSTRSAKRDVEILTLLASQAAVAIENARLYEAVRANEVRLEKEVRFAQRVQAALLPVGLPKRMKGVEVAASFDSGARARRGLPRFPVAGIQHAGRRGRRRVGQGRAGRALQRVRRGAGTRPHVPPPLPAGALDAGERAVVGEHDPAPAPARGVLLHAVLLDLRSQAADRDARQLRICRTRFARPGRRSRRSSCRACRSDRFPARATTRSPSRCTPAICSCSAATACSRR